MKDVKLDIVFKFIFSDEKDEDSMYLLKLLLENTLDRKIQGISIKNPEYLQQNPNDKGARYDIKVQDDLKRTYNVEMQNSVLSNTLVKRFTLYGSKMINENLHIGEDYKNLRQNIQIILIDDSTSNQLVVPYEFKSDRGEREGKNIQDDEVILIRYYIFLPYINILAREKGIDQFNEYEMMIYILNNGIDDEMKKRKKKEIVKRMERRIEKFYTDEELSALAFQRQVILATLDEEKEEFYENGKKEGIKEGIKKAKDRSIKTGKIESIIEILQIKYPDKDLTWIYDCDDGQLKYIQKLLLQTLQYEEFYRKVQRYVS